MPPFQRFFPVLSAACLTLGSGSAFAQAPAAAPGSATSPTPPAAAAVKPASGTVITDMSLSHAVNICELAVTAKVPVQTSLPSAARGMAYVITTLHGSQVASLATLSPEQMFDGSLIEILAKVNNGCFSKLNAADQKTVSSLMAGINAAAKLQPAPAP